MLCVFAPSSSYASPLRSSPATSGLSTYVWYYSSNATAPLLLRLELYCLVFSSESHPSHRNLPFTLCENWSELFALETGLNLHRIRPEEAAAHRGPVCLVAGLFVCLDGIQAGLWENTSTDPVPSDGSDSLVTSVSATNCWVRFTTGRLLLLWERTQTFL